MTTTVEYLGGAAFEVQTRSHRVVCDQPLENGGEDQGMSPPEFLLASLGACAAYYALQYLKARSLLAENLKVRVLAGKAPGPARLASFRLEVVLPGLDGQHRDGVLRAVKACLIHNTLLHAPAIETVIETGAAVRTQQLQSR